MKKLSNLLVFLMIIFTSTSVFSNTYAYVTNHDSDTVSVVDLKENTLISTIDVGKNPSFLASSPDGALVYVANEGNVVDRTNSSISVIDTSTQAVVKTIPLPYKPTCPYRPTCISVSVDGKYCYVGLTYRKMSVIDTDSQRLITTLNLPCWVDLIYCTPDGSHVYVHDIYRSIHCMMETENHTEIATITESKEGVHTMFTPDKKYKLSYDVCFCNSNPSLQVYNIYDDCEIAEFPYSKDNYSFDRSYVFGGDFKYICCDSKDILEVCDAFSTDLVCEVPVGKKPSSVIIVSTDNSDEGFFQWLFSRD